MMPRSEDWEVGVGDALRRGGYIVQEFIHIGQFVSRSVNHSLNAEFFCPDADFLAGARTNKCDFETGPLGQTDRQPVIDGEIFDFRTIREDSNSSVGEYSIYV